MIVVTGVHRSGTSLVAMLMAGMGVDFGPHEAFYPGDEWNPRGYFERRDVMDLNSRLITGFARSRGGLESWASQARYLSAPSRAAIRRRGARLAKPIEELAARVSELAVKGPALLPDPACLGTIRRPEGLRFSASDTPPRSPSPSAGVRGCPWPSDTGSGTTTPPRSSMPRRCLPSPVDHAALFGPDPLSELHRLAEFLGKSTERSFLESLLENRRSRELRNFEAGSATPEAPRSSMELWERLASLRERQPDRPTARVFASRG